MLSFFLKCLVLYPGLPQKKIKKYNLAWCGHSTLRLICRLLLNSQRIETIWERENIFLFAVEQRASTVILWKVKYDEDFTVCRFIVEDWKAECVAFITWPCYYMLY